MFNKLQEQNKKLSRRQKRHSVLTQRSEVAGAVAETLLADLPTAGIPGRVLFVSDGCKCGEVSPNCTGTVIYDDGSDWVRMCDGGEPDGSTGYYEDLRFPVGAIKVGSTKVPPNVTYKSGILLNFQNQGVIGNEEYIYFEVQMPHGWIEGTDINPHVHWVGENNNAGNVRWRLTYSWANIGEVFPAATTIYVTDANSSTADFHNYADFGSIAATGKTGSSMLICSLSRNSSDAADTYASGAYLLEVDIHYLRNRYGEPGSFPTY